MNPVQLLGLNRKKARMPTKNANKIKIPSPEEIAELNLIQISNLEYSDVHEGHEAKKNPVGGNREIQDSKNLLPRKRKITYSQNQHKSVELKRISVTERWTQSFKAGRKTNSTLFKTNTLPPTLLPISVSNYLLLGGEKRRSGKSLAEVSEEKTKNSDSFLYAKLHRPKPSIASRTFYFRHGSSLSSKEKSDSEFKEQEDFQRRKIFPREESYWKIKKV